MSVQTAKKLVINRWVLMGLIVLIGVTVRTVNLAEVGSLSFDEAWSVRIARKSLTAGLAIVTHDKHPPLFYMLLHIWIRLVGTSEFSLRFLSVLAGIVCVVVIYQVGREMFDQSTGLVAALMVAVGPFQVWYSQEARMYPLSLAFSLLSVLFLWKARDQKSPKYWAGYIFFTLLMVFTHYIAGLVLVGQAAFLLLDALENRERIPVLKKWLLCLLAMGLVGLPWLPTVISQVQIDSGPPPWIAQLFGTPTLMDLLFNTFFLHFLLSNPELYPRWLRLVTYSIGMALLALAILETRLSFPFLKVTRQTAVVFCLLCLALPIGTVWLISQHWPMYVPRYLLAFSGYLYLLFAWGIQKIPHRWGRFLVTILIVATLAMGSVQSYHEQRERDWGTIAGYILEHGKESDVVVITPPANWIVFSYYTQGRIPHDLTFYHQLYPSYPTPPTETELVSSFLAQPLPYERLWWIDEQGTGLAAEWEADPGEVVRRFLDQYFSREEIPGELSSSWGNVFLYQLDRSDDTAK